MRHRGGSRSERAAALLRGSGYDARALDGGFPAWEAAGYPVERGERGP
jgi:rhodanese-related sulfurtransferase